MTCLLKFVTYIWFFFPISKGDEGPRGVNGPRGPRGRQVSHFVF